MTIVNYRKYSEPDTQIYDKDNIHSLFTRLICTILTIHLLEGTQSRLTAGKITHQQIVEAAVSIKNDRNWTQTQFAKAAGFGSTPTVSNWIRGVRVCRPA